MNVNVVSLYGLELEANRLIFLFKTFCTSCKLMVTNDKTDIGTSPSTHAHEYWLLGASCCYHFLLFWSCNWYNALIM